MKSLGLIFKKYLKIAVLIFALVGLLVTLFFSWSFFRGETKVRTNGTAVVKELRNLNRYETISYSVEKIIDKETEGNKFSQLLFGDKILLIAHGEVIAGFDFSKMEKDAVKVEGATITVDLPKPQILVSRLDAEKTRVYDRRLGLLTRGDKDLESEARKDAEISLREAACSEDILEKASSNGREQLTALLKALGFQNVVLNIPYSSC